MERRPALICSVELPTAAWWQRWWYGRPFRRFVPYDQRNELLELAHVLKFSTILGTIFSMFLSTFVSTYLSTCFEDEVVHYAGSRLHPSHVFCKFIADIMVVEAAGAALPPTPPLGHIELGQYLETVAPRRLLATLARKRQGDAPDVSRKLDAFQLLPTRLRAAAGCDA